jgi:biotin carboxyl carrier protein
MPLNEEDVREILRLIDESADLAELRIETGSLSLHVLRGEPQDVPGAARRAAPPAGGLASIDASMVGTFYRAEAPGASPFVDVGSRVEPTTVVGIIEVMKMMNSIPAGLSGTIAEVCVDNAQPVEFGTTLFRVRADA